MTLEDLARVYRPRPEKDRVVGAEPESKPEADLMRGGERGIEAPGDPCTCAVIGGQVNGGPWNPKIYGHHYRCPVWNLNNEGREVDDGRADFEWQHQF